MSLPTVLLVDDDEATLLALPELVQWRLSGVRIDTCASAFVALERIATHDYDAIISDIKLPGIDGLTLLARIRALQPDTPTLLISAHDEQDYALQALRGGAYDFIRKPIDTDYFVAALARAIRLRQLSRRLEDQQLTLAQRAEALAQSEATLRHKTRILRSVLDSMGDGVVVADETGRLLLFNAAAEQMLGTRTRDAAADLERTPGRARTLGGDEAGRAALAVIHDCALARALAGEAVDAAEVSIPHAGAAPSRWLSVTARPLREDTGTPRGGVAVFRDITARKQAEEAVRASEERLRRIVETAHDAFIAIDARSVIVDWNPQAEATFGWSRAEAVGQPLTPLIIPPHYREAHERGLERFLATGAGPLLNRRAELTALHRDGHEFPVELTIAPVRSGSAYLFNAFVRDITERKRVEEMRARRVRQAALRAEVGTALTEVRPALRVLLQRCAEALVRHLDAASTHVWTLSKDREVLELQAAAGTPMPLSGSLGRVRVGQSMVGVIAQERRPQLSNDVRNDARFANPQGAPQEGVAAFAGYPLLVEDRLVGVLTLFARQPLTEDTVDALASVADALGQGIARRQAEEALAQRAEELARSNRELEQFAYVASHDLQEPLRMVASYTQLLARRYRDRLDADAEEFIAYAVDGATRMQGLINDLLAYSRVGTRAQPLQPTDCEAVFQTAVANLRAAIAESGAVVTHEPLPTVLADAGQLVQVFQNLLANAIKFRTATPPEVQVSAVRRAEHWRFCVRDNGIGIDPQYADRLFVIFQRLHSREEYPGSGIGLAICKKIVERHGGCITVESQPGQGARFFFTLPALEATSP